MSELNWQIKKVEKEVMELKKHDVSDDMMMQRDLKTARNVRNLEDRLGVVTSKFNMMVASNGKLRQEINHLLKERAHFNKLYQQLVFHLNAGKKVMVDLIEQATFSYDQREEAQNKLKALKDRGKQDLLIQSQEMRELQRHLDHDIKLQDFLGVKGQRRILSELEAKEALKKRKKRENTEQLITTYEGILSQIKEFTGENDIDRLTAQFVKQEEENFAIFNYVNELNNEVESLQERVCELRIKIDEQRELSNERAKQQQETLSRLCQTLQEKLNDAKETEIKLKNCNTALNTLLRGIEQIFHLVRCDNDPVLALLGENVHVTPYNVMLYLEIIERRTNELMNVVFYLQHLTPMAETEEEKVQLRDLSIPQHPPMEKIVPTHPCPLCVEEEEMTQEEDEETLFPLTRGEVEKRVQDLEQDPERDISERLHNVSVCRLPRSRKIMQSTYE
ncbi:hypothetical protein L9F63_006989 [Diploptera punctata]|uniref:ODAD1 central coiled coil region domain-containing protein n=1 Tax=Diploptera punctata TaxID=6984 RepID=A0AAD7Z9P3_DIPPU|nr:hypothetical protein L9F63_006989 [Diploptera punctata]